MRKTPRHIRATIDNPTGFRPLPSLSLLRRLREKAGARGFYCDWSHIGILGDGSLLLMRNPENPKQAHLIVKKSGGKWVFKFETDLLNGRDSVDQGTSKRKGSNK